MKKSEAQLYLITIVLFALLGCFALFIGSFFMGVSFLVISIAQLFIVGTKYDRSEK